MANNLTLDQISKIANAVVSQAQGDSIDNLSVKDFTTVADIALKTGYDPLNTAISQVLSRTIFSSRAYNGMFQGLQKNDIQYGNHVRKVNYVSQGVIDDERMLDTSKTDGVDPWKIRPMTAVQTNFYGEQMYQNHVTRWKDQLDTAFKSPEEFGAYFQGVFTEVQNELTQVKESLSRGALLNLIAGVSANGTKNKNVIHLLTEYNDATGQGLTAESVLQGQNYKNFMQWVYARITTLIDYLAIRGYLYHVNPNTSDQVNGTKYKKGEVSTKKIMRFTPKDKLHMYVNSQFINQSETMAIANTFHDDYLKLIDYEKVPFWQSVDKPLDINVTATYMTCEDGKVSTLADTQAELSNVVGVLFDDEAIGVTNVNEWMGSTPLNPAGGYWNYYWHRTCRYWNDFTENAIVLVLD